MVQVNRRSKIQAMRLVFGRRLGLTALLAISFLSSATSSLLAHQSHNRSLISNQNFPLATSPQGFMDLEHARLYMLELINRDRASVGSPPVTLDEVGCKAGQLHSDEMAQYGYLSHWTMDGRKPDQRYTECGGKDAVAENAEATEDSNPKKLPLCQKQGMFKQDVEEIENQFFHEKPPNDGHRVNIIDPAHTSVGLGLSIAGAEPESGGDMPRTACAQEFINHYGDYAPLPLSLAPGEPLVVEGTLNRGLQLQSIDLRWEKLPEPMTIEALNNTSSYGIPDAAVFSYFPPPYESPAPVNITMEGERQHFALSAPTTKDWKPGIYYVCVWAQVPNQKETVIISKRTVRIGPAQVESNHAPADSNHSQADRAPSESNHPQRLHR